MSMPALLRYRVKSLSKAQMKRIHKSFVSNMACELRVNKTFTLTSLFTLEVKKTVHRTPQGRYVGYAKPYITLKPVMRRSYNETLTVPRLRKSEVQKLADKLGFSYDDVHSYLWALMQAITEVAFGGPIVNLPGLGAFRPNSNPRTNRPVLWRPSRKSPFWNKLTEEEVAALRAKRKE